MTPEPNYLKKREEEVEWFNQGDSEIAIRK